MTTLALAAARTAQVIALHKVDPYTSLAVMGKILGITRQRVSQILKRENIKHTQRPGIPRPKRWLVADTDSLRTAAMKVLVAPPKQKRPRLSKAEKLQVIAAYDANPTLTHQKIAERFGITRHRVGQILRDEQKRRIFRIYC